MYTIYNIYLKVLNKNNNSINYKVRASISNRIRY